MRKMSLKMKLSGGFFLVAVITMVVGIIGWRGVSSTGAALIEVGYVRMPSLDGLQIMLAAQMDIQKAERCLLIPEFLNDANKREHQIKDLEAAWKAFDRGWRLYEPLPQTAEEAVLWNKFKSVYETWKKEHQSTIHLIKNGNRSEALTQSGGKTNVSFEATEALLHELIDLQNRESARFIKESIGDVDRPKVLMGITAAAGILVAVSLGLLLSLAISRSLNQIAASLDENAAQVASASMQVSAASQQVAAGASEQAATLEETYSSINEISSITKRNTQSAQQADALTKEANLVVKQASGSMEELTTSIHEISKASEDTSKIIKTIDEIAFQTNLLALNAAVEAARAGEAGAGFAVVADEVRNLAMRAAEAAKDTAGLIEETVKRVNAGGELVRKTNEAFTEVTTSVARIEALVTEIVGASGAQAEGIHQVNHAMTQMEQVVQQNASNAEENASASEELSAQAEVMKEHVGELVILVEGGMKRNGRQFVTRRSQMAIRDKEVFGGSSLPIKTGKSKMRNPKSSIMSPQRLIAMGDEEASMERLCPSS